jgi:WD40 repeat protein
MRSKKGKSATILAAIVGLIICFIFGLLFVLWPFHKTHPQDSDVVIASFSSDSKKILAGTREGMAYLWNVDDQRLLGFTCVSKSAIDRSPAPFNSLALAPQGQFIVVAGSTLALLTIASSRSLLRKSGHRIGVRRRCCQSRGFSYFRRFFHGTALALAASRLANAS